MGNHGSSCGSSMDASLYISIKKVNEIVDNVVAGKTIFPVDDDPGVGTFLQDDKTKIVFQPEDYVDTLREIKGEITDFVTQEMLGNADVFFRFLYMIITAFQQAFRRYRVARGLTFDQCFFIYKGGNINRFLAEEFLLQLPAQAMREVQTWYNPYFKRSDADFAVLIHPSLPNYSLILRETGEISYYIQDYLRSHFGNDMCGSFVFPRYRPTFQRSVLKQLLNKVRTHSHDALSIHALAYPGVATDTGLTYRYHPDIYLSKVTMNQKRELQGRWIQHVPIHQARSSFYISYNRTLNFKKASGLRAQFDLIRTKLALTSDKGFLSGELIDVAIPHQNDIKHKGFYSTGQNENVSRYTMTHKEHKLSFYSYSLNYLIKDLFWLLFGETGWPWDDPKYEKRLHRLTFLIFVSLFVNLTTNDQRIAIINNIISVLVQIKNKGSAGVQSESIRTVNEFYKHLSALFIKVKTKPEQDAAGLFLETLLLDFRFMLRVISHIEEYCGAEGTVELASIQVAPANEVV